MEDNQFEFEGDQITDFTAQLPMVKLPTEEAYPRGTYIRVTAEYRVRSVSLSDSKKGEGLTRHHVLVLEDLAVTSTQTPAERRALMQAAEELEAQQLASHPKVIQEEPGHEDASSAEEWSALTEDEKAELRRQAVDTDVDEFEAHEPVSEDLPVQEGPGLLVNELETVDF